MMMKNKKIGGGEEEASSSGVVDEKSGRERGRERIVNNKKGERNTRRMRMRPQNVFISRGRRGCERESEDDTTVLQNMNF
jgi:hypothetical protein